MNHGDIRSVSTGRLSGWGGEKELAGPCYFEVDAYVESADNDLTLELQVREGHSTTYRTIQVATLGAHGVDASERRIAWRGFATGIKLYQELTNIPDSGLSNYQISMFDHRD